MDYRHSQIYPVQAISASHSDLLVAIHKMWNFTSGEGVSLVNSLAEHSFAFFLCIHSHLFCALHLLLHRGSTCLHQAERVKLQDSNPFSCLHRQGWQGEHTAGRSAYPVNPQGFFKLFCHAALGSKLRTSKLVANLGKTNRHWLNSQGSLKKKIKNKNTQQKEKHNSFCSIRQ